MSTYVCKIKAINLFCQFCLDIYYICNNEPKKELRKAHRPNATGIYRPNGAKANAF